jgi:hypothetical protein
VPDPRTQPSVGTGQRAWQVGREARTPASAPKKVEFGTHARPVPPHRAARNAKLPSRTAHRAPGSVLLASMSAREPKMKDAVPVMPPPLPRRRLLAAAAGAAGLAALPLAACGGGSISPAPAPPPVPTRTWAMGFSPFPPRLTVEAVIQGIDLWSRRADIAIIHEELPWTDLLAGMSADAILDRDKVQLVQYIRSKGVQRLVFMGDLNDGLAREREAPQLRAAGRSITEPAVQRLYRDYLLAVDRKLAPEVIGLVAESNLIRAAAPTLYPAVRQTANDTAAALRGAGTRAALMASVQVEAAWGRLGGSGSYTGIEADFADFPFLQVLGLSSYPYFGWSTPEDLPLDYYTRLRGGRSVPVMVVEGGWTSAAAGSIASTPERQARYIARHAELLDAVGARGWLQILFADVDLAALPPPLPANLPLFAKLGLTDSNFAAKPALAAWDALFARTLVR